MKKCKIKNATPYGIVCNKNKTKGVITLVIPDRHMPSGTTKFDIILTDKQMESRGFKNEREE